MVQSKNNLNYEINLVGKFLNLCSVILEDQPCKIDIDDSQHKISCYITNFYNWAYETNNYKGHFDKLKSEIVYFVKEFSNPEPIKILQFGRFRRLEIDYTALVQLLKNKQKERENRFFKAISE